MALFSGLSVTAGNQCVLFTWDEMVSIDFPFVSASGFLINYRFDTNPINPSDGYLAVRHYFESGSTSYYVHKNLINGAAYYYRAWPILPDNTYGVFGLTLAPITPVSSAQLFSRAQVTYTKLGYTSKIYSRPSNAFRTDVVIWLPYTQNSRKDIILNSIHNLKPAHTSVHVLWEPYYVAQTTTTQFQACTYDPDVYEVVSGSIKNKIATFNSVFDGNTNI